MQSRVLQCDIATILKHNNFQKLSFKHIILSSHWPLDACPIEYYVAQCSNNVKLRH